MEMIYERKVDNLHYISVSKELSQILSEFNWINELLFPLDELLDELFFWYG